MGQIDCHCLQQETKKQTTIEEKIDSKQLKKKLQHFGKINNNRYNKILNPVANEHKILNNENKNNNCVPKKIYLILKNIISENKTIKIQIQDSSTDQEIFQIGTDNTIPEQFRILNESQDDQFKLSVKYVSNHHGSGNFYMKDEGLGLGCFYKLKSKQKLQLKPNMLINIGNQFIIPLFNKENNEIDNSMEYEKQKIFIKIHGGVCNGEQYELNKQQNFYTIGKSAQSKITLNDITLSNIHCEIFYEDQKWFIIELNEYQISKKGVWIYMSSTVKIEHGMIIKCGATYFKSEIKKEDR